jgi:hypothetical protein
MARELLRRAVHVVPLLPAIDRVAVVDALSIYAQTPSASRYLKAWRLLRETGRHARSARFSGAGVSSDFAHQIDALLASPLMDASLGELWKEHLAVDRKTPDRVRALTLLLSSYEHLAGRVLAEQDELAKQLKKSGVRRRKAR